MCLHVKYQISYTLVKHILSIMKKIIFTDLQCKAAHERDIQREVEKAVQIRECDDTDAVTHKKVVILELNNYVLIHLKILDVVDMMLHTILTYLTELVGS
jgi:hypothetical protein